MAKSFKELEKKMSPESLRRSDDMAQEMKRNIRLSELRKALNLTQKELADRLGVSQASISQLEDRPDILLGTLKRYVEIMGAELVIKARLPEGDEIVIDHDSLQLVTDEDISD